MRKCATLLAILTLILAATTTAGAQKPTIFGVVKHKGEGNPMYSYLKDGRFQPALPPWSRETIGARQASLDSLLNAYRGLRAMPGFSASGEPISVDIETVRQPQGLLFETLFGAHSDLKDGDYPALFWSGSRKQLDRLIPVKQSLPSAVRMRLEELADSLFEAAIPYCVIVDKGATGSVALGDFRVEAVPTRDTLVTVYVPATINWKNWGLDKRASFFFILSRIDWTVRFARFGHPEWAPVDPERVLIVRPLVYFRVAASGEVYFFGDYKGPWENIGEAIYRLSDGSVVARCD